MDVFKSWEQNCVNMFRRATPIGNPVKIYVSCGRFSTKTIFTFSRKPAIFSFTFLIVVVNMTNRDKYLIETAETFTYWSLHYCYKKMISSQINHLTRARSFISIRTIVFADDNYTEPYNVCVIYAKSIRIWKMRV